MDYEFDAPLYLDFYNQDSENNDNLEPVAVSAEERMEHSNKPEVPESTHSEEHLPSEAENPNEGQNRKTPTPKATTQTNLQSTKQPSQPLRQSPRLAAIAKSIRRSNASRVFVPTSSRASSGIPKAHRRSLSEGANINTRFSRVEKTTVQRKVAVVRPKQNEKPGASGLALDDLANLEQTSQYQKILSSNRQRSTASSGSKGPLKPVGVRPAPLKPTKKTEFHFATDSRVKSKANVKEEPSVDFQRILRSQCASSYQDHPKGPTKVQPFNLHGSSKPREVGQPFVSLAELNLKFQTKTPQRFRSKRYGLDKPTFPEISKKTRSNSGGLTHPHTPQLTTKLRTRSVNYPTREEIEEKELEEAREHQFKAKPINKKILTEPSVNPSETTRQSTVPQPFNITDMKKAINKPMEKTLLDYCPDFLGSASSLASIPHGGISSSWEKRSTEVKPFSFDSRDAEIIKKKKEKIKMMIEEERKKSEFHAQPMPVFDAVKGLPTKKPPTPTKVQPFKLRSDIRGSARQETLQRELEALEELEQQQRKFAAQPDTVLHKQPFIPQKSNKPLTDISGFSLNTDRRAEERQAFDTHLKWKEDELMARKKELEERKRLEEEVEVQQLRKNAVHKAQPVRRYKPVAIKHGLLPPTTAISPDFATNRRLRTRAKSEQNYSVTSDSTLNDACGLSTTVVSSGPADGTFSMG